MLLGKYATFGSEIRKHKIDLNAFTSHSTIYVTATLITVLQKRPRKLLNQRL